MENKIVIFVGDGVNRLKNILRDYMIVREFKYERKAGDPMLSESDFILYSLGDLYEGGFIADMKVDFDNGELDPIVLDDFAARIDPAVNLAPYFNDLCALGVPVFYFAHSEISVERITSTGVPVVIYNEKLIDNK